MEKNRTTEVCKETQTIFLTNNVWNWNGSQRKRSIPKNRKSHSHPSYYKKNSQEETDERIVHVPSEDQVDTLLLPQMMLHNWALYNADSKLISLELLPMKTCADSDVTIFGSGGMTVDDETYGGFSLDGSDSSSLGSHPDALPIFLSPVKEWMVESGSNTIFISLRTNLAWYRLGNPSEQYAPWFEPVLRTVRIAIRIITLLDQETRASRLSFQDVSKKLSQLPVNDKAYISPDTEVVERYLVVYGQLILQLFGEYPNDDIKRCPFIKQLARKTKETKETHHKSRAIKKKGKKNPSPKSRI